MPQVTKIYPQLRHNDIYNIEVDEKFLCGLSGAQLEARGLNVGDQLVEEEIGAILADSLNSKAYNASLRYLSYRPRSVQEVRHYLARKGYDCDAIDSAIGRLLEMGYLNDGDFALSWVASRMATKPRSSKVLRLELRSKGVDKEYVDSALSELLDPDSELALLRNVVAKKLRLAKYSTDIQKLTQYLLGQGYKYSDVRTVVSQLAINENKSDNGSNNREPQ